MKKFLILLVLTFFVASVFADFMQQVERIAEYDNVPVTHRVYENTSRDVPEWEFLVDPTGVLTNYYDYQPGSYNSTPIRIQPDEVGGGIYIAFHAKETAASTRRVYYAYIDADGNVTNTATISTDDLIEGYAGIDIDPVTGNPIVAWHANMDTGSADNECVITYDMFHLGSPGLWKAPFVVIDESFVSNSPSDEFEWPYVYIGPSPETGKRRAYISANNAFDTTGDPSENILFAYADFDVNDFNVQSELDWTYFTIPLMDQWNQGIPEWKRPNCSVQVSDDGKVAIYGYVITDGETSTTPDMMFCFLNSNYGEGDFEYFEGQAEFDIANPQNQDGTSRFIDPDTNLPHELYMEPYLCNHQNTVFANNNTQLKFAGTMNMMLRPSNWYPDLPIMYPKMYTFDLNTEEFSFQDLYLTGADPYDDNPMIPWDLDEDGLVDEYDDEGYVTWVEGWPIYHYDNAVAFHENSFKITKNDDQEWLCAVWSEGLKSRLGNIPEPGFEDWAEYPEIAIAVSGNGGETWEETIILNAKSGDDNYVPELDGMIPEYIYPGDVIEDLGDGYGLVHLFFLDDNSYGSFIQAHGENLGGTMIYTSLKIYFGDNGGNNAGNNLITPQIATLSQNYPNPFNPSTEINYSLNEAADVSIEVFNVKGQKVTTLVDDHQEAGQHEITWNGDDISGKSVTSGVYFYKMKAGERYISTRKMILLK
jgi:FlgD Ig-like domain